MNENQLSIMMKEMGYDKMTSSRILKGGVSKDLTGQYLQDQQDMLNWISNFALFLIIFGEVTIIISLMFRAKGIW